MLPPKGIELELPTLRDRATGVLNELLLSFLCKSRPEERWRGTESPKRGESKESTPSENPRLNLQIAVRGDREEMAAALEKKERREREGGRRGRGPIYRRTPRSG